MFRNILKTHIKVYGKILNMTFNVQKLNYLHKLLLERSKTLKYMFSPKGEGCMSSKH